MSHTGALLAARPAAQRAAARPATAAVHTAPAGVPRYLAGAAASSLAGTDAAAEPVERADLGGLRLQRQCACGGAGAPSDDTPCDSCGGGLQRQQLAVGAANDPLEAEADRVADAVLAAPAGAVGRAPPGIQRAGGAARPAGGNSAPVSVARTLAAPGEALAAPLRHDMQQRFGHDFSAVRVHRDAPAAASAREVEAHAYTVGEHVVFAENRYAPTSDAGRRLLAHELTHVVQQRGGGHGGAVRRKAGDGDVTEVKAMDRQQALAVLGADTTRGVDEGATLLTLIATTLSGPATLQNARTRLERLIAAFSLLAPDDAALLLQTLTAPANPAQQRIKEHFDQLDHRFREPLLGLLKDMGAAAAARAAQRDSATARPRYQEGKATWVELHAGVFAIVPDPGQTLKDVASYVSRHPDLPAGLVKLNGVPVDQRLEPGQTVIVPIELIDNERAIGEMSAPMRKRIGAARQAEADAARARRLMTVGPGARGPGMDGLFPVATLALKGGVMIIVDALLALLKGVAYGVSFLAGIVHGFFASLWDTVSGIVKMIYDVIDSIVSGELLSDIKKLIDGLKGVTKSMLRDMLGEWAEKWDEKLNSPSPFVAGHAHGYLTGYVMAEAAMLLLSGGASAELKAGFWATRVGKLIKASEPFIAAGKVVEKAAAAGGKVTEVIEVLRKSKVGAVVKTVDVAVTIAGWTLERVGKVLSLPGDIAVYIVEQAFRNAEMLGEFFPRIGKLATRAKRWLFGCFSPCDWKADVTKKVLKQLSDEQIKVASEAANAKDLKTWLGRPARNGNALPEGYHWRDGDIARSPGKREANFAPLTVDPKTGNLTIKLSAERISNPSVMNRNYRAALKEELKSANKGLSDAKLDAKVEKIASQNAVHHLIPDNVVQDHPLGIAARQAGYDLDRGSNLKGLKKTERLTDADAGDIGHWSSHSNYDKLVEQEMTRVQKALEAEFGSLDKMLKKDALKKRLLDEMKKVEDKFRLRFDQGKVPVDPDTGRLTEVVRAPSEELVA